MVFAFKNVTLIDTDPDQTSFTRVVDPDPDRSGVLLGYGSGV